MCCDLAVLVLIGTTGGLPSVEISGCLLSGGGIPKLFGVGMSCINWNALAKPHLARYWSLMQRQWNKTYETSFFYFFIENLVSLPGLLVKVEDQAARLFTNTDEECFPSVRSAMGVENVLQLFVK